MLAIRRCGRYVGHMATQLNLGADFEAKVDALVAQGRFASREDVVREGLRLIEERDAETERLRADLIAMLEEGLADVEAGRTYPIEDVMSEMEMRYRNWPKAAE